MDAYRIEVFDSSSPTPRLRWFDNEGRMVHRVLDRTAIDEFIAAVEQKYQVLGADLADLGGMLYRWLDGPTERWLAAAREKQRPIGVHLDCDGRLRHLPWELIHDGGFLAVSAGQPIWPVRCASPGTGHRRRWQTGLCGCCSWRASLWMLPRCSTSRARRR